MRKKADAGEENNDRRGDGRIHKGKRSRKKGNGREREYGEVTEEGTGKGWIEMSAEKNDEQAVEGPRRCFQYKNRGFRSRCGGGCTGLSSASPASSKPRWLTRTTGEGRRS